MRIYTVHARHLATDPDKDLVLVKEGFCWPAFFFGFLWAAWHRMWWVALGLLAAGLIFDYAAKAVGVTGAQQGWLWIGFAALTGYLANDLRRWHLARRGLPECDVVTGDDADLATLRYLDSEPTLARDLQGSVG